MTLKAYLQDKITIINDALDKYLEYKKPHPEVIYESMRYSVFAGGKRLRPVFMLATCEAFGGDSQVAIPAACAVEMIHTYSLIHDDLPAMDNDDYRRGKLTNHKKFNEATAILAGDALLTKAFGTICLTDVNKVHPNVIHQMLCEISTAAGAEGMVGGQVADMEAEGKQIELQDLEYIHAHKTGALLSVAIRCGAILANASLEQQKYIGIFADQLGLAFQIQDDILDIVGNQEVIGKKVGSDIDNNKATYPRLIGLEQSKAKVQELTEQALQALELANCKDSTYLRAIANYLISRES
ncbi:hypothetical protein BHU72_02400 [Desulfuribacillus stibiiarsenatis]|uniref:Farnesyl diphosphate synthase n=1 Tax=Desulfuribacillus stibiiarsenatis TaxID=1390249 RepID=A0A1E5L7F2_9FIRM|nr:farnesyl diphosphate synthase [Desulfuribacillus stibiiarsenatis]OEH85944.1 hypothetical protein BHU72_02400 [Desulfuribacillus stibiiarsenatis]